MYRPNEMAVVPWSGHVDERTAEEGENVEIVDLVVQDADDWVISGLLIDGLSRHTGPDIAETFAQRLRRDAPIRVPQHAQVGLTGVVYAGRRSSAKFYGCILGRVANTRGPRAGFSHGSWNGREVILPMDSKGWRGQRDTSVSLTHHVDGAPILVRSLVIRTPHDWIINNLRIDGRSQLLYPGDLPSEALLVPERLDMHLDVAHCEVEIMISYDGEQEPGPELRCTIVGCSLDN